MSCVASDIIHELQSNSCPKLTDIYSMGKMNEFHMTETHDFVGSHESW